jgi:hypothetical protein
MMRKDATNSVMMRIDDARLCDIVRRALANSFEFLRARCAFEDASGQRDGAQPESASVR